GLRARLEVAVAHGPSTEARRDGLLDALEQTERLACLAEDLLSLSVIEGSAPQHATVRLDSLTSEVVEFLAPIAEEQGRPFHYRVERGLAVRGSVSLLKRLMLNLVDNAFRHTPPGGAVDLSVVAADGVAVVEVRDRGPGIAPDDLPLAFERFHRGRTS